MIDWLQPVISNLLVASLIGGLAWLAGRGGKRAPLAHLLWVAFFVKLVTPPIVLLPISVPEAWIPSVALDRSPPQVSVASSSIGNSAKSVHSLDANSSVSIPSDDSRVPSGAWATPGLLFPCLWFCGVAYFLARGFIRFLRFRRLLHREGIPDEAAGEFVATLINSTNIQPPGKRRYSPQVLRIPIRISPMLFGFGHRPVIVCPDLLWKSLSEEERHSFLAHEAAHYCRRDHWVRWLEWFVTAIYWWFPGVYLARGQLERHEEACCDAWAVRILRTPPRQYADALLRVVDFISEYQVRIPRFASGMQPTTSLEERLRLVMQIGRQPEPSRRLQLCFALAGCSLLILHPIPEPIAEAKAASKSDSTKLIPKLNRLSDFESEISPHNEMNSIDLPPVPQGYWNRKPREEWAEFSLSLPGAKLTADVRRGMTIEIENGQSLYFPPDELRVLVEIPSNKRVVIGSRDGSVRVWDLIVGAPVSLLGRHAKDITGLAYHETFGLVSGDAAGTLIRWDLQSGQMLATLSIPKSSVQSIRFSEDGVSLAVLTGSWNASNDEQTVYIVDGQSLDPDREIRLTRRTALVLANRDREWVAIDWSGVVRSMETDEVIGRISKPLVSAMLLSQEVSLPELTNKTDNEFEEIP